MQQWVNWQDYEADGFAARGKTFEEFLTALQGALRPLHPRVRRAGKRRPGRGDRPGGTRSRSAGSRFSSHVWRASAAGNLGGWQSARALVLLHALTGSLGTRGGLSPNTWDKFVPEPFKVPPAQEALERDCSTRPSGRSATTSSRSYCRTS